jgi:hypothetical protein
MALADVTFAVFSLFNALQLVSYIPQIVAVARDRNGATAISYSSWAIWLAGAAATVAYATINIWDVWLALVNAAHALCCLLVILLTAFKRYSGRQTS